jgi:hypothetical protein
VPKGVVLIHAALAGKLAQIQDALSFGSGLWVALLSLLHGGLLVMAPKFEPAAVLHTLAEQRITQAGGPFLEPVQGKCPSESVGFRPFHSTVGGPPMRHAASLRERAGRRAAPKPARIPAGDRPTNSSDEGLT